MLLRHAPAALGLFIALPPFGRLKINLRHPDNMPIRTPPRKGGFSMEAAIPRNGSGVYNLPAAYLATTGTTITATQHNVPLTDIEADLNAARPVGAGGTGASTAAQARTNLGLAIGSNVAAYADRVPSGLIGMWSGSIASIPSGWVLCDGNNGTPNLTDMFIVGAGNSYAVGDTGGADSVTLTTAQIPSHTHPAGTLATASAGSHDHNITRGTSDGAGASIGSSGGALVTQTDAVSTAGAHTHAITGSTASVGSGDAHENRPPYYALFFIMKS